MSEEKNAEQSSENRYVEYQREFNEAALRSIVAYANTDGGKIYVGIDEFGRAYGVQNAEEIARRIESLARDRIRPDASSCVECRVERRDGHDVVVATIFRGDARPYWLTSKGLCPSGSPIAEGGRVVAPSERRLRTLLAETGCGSFERERSRQQVLTFDQACKVFDEEKLSVSEKTFRELGLVDASGTFTNLALLLSDQCPSTIRLAFFEGVRENQIHDRLELSGSILRQYRDAFDFLDQYNRTNDALRAANHGDYHDYPAEILREALLNAIIHRDYKTEARTIVRHYHNRIEIVSPGGLPQNLRLDELELGVSAPRNPRLANVFYLLEYVESCGVGVRKIRQAYASCPAAPTFDASPNYFKTTLYNASVLPARKRRPRRDRSHNAPAAPVVQLPADDAQPAAPTAPTVHAPSRAIPAAESVVAAPTAARPVDQFVAAPTASPASEPVVASAASQPAPATTPEPAATQPHPAAPDRRARRMTTIRDALSVASPTLASASYPGASSSIAVPAPLSDRERQALEMFNTRGTITCGDVERALNLTQASAAAILRRLVNAGRLVLCGAGSNIWYRLP